MLPLTISLLTLDGLSIHAEPAGPALQGMVEALARGPVVLLGAFGGGKTHLMHQLEAREHVTVVPLRLLDPDRPIWDSLIGLIGRDRLDEARSGERPLLLDGLDEARFDGSTLQARFAELVEVVGPRWLISSRPAYFRTSETGDDDQVDSLAAGLPTFILDPLPTETVRNELLGLGGERLLASVDGLCELATSPILLQVAGSALPHILPGQPIEAWGLFDAWIRHALRTGPDHDAAVDRLVQLAWEVCIEHDFHPSGIRFSRDLPHQHRIPAGLRSALMVTDLDGRSRFAHRSVLEFLVASHLAPRIHANQGLGPDALSGFRLSEATRAFLVGRVGPMQLTFEGRRVLIPRGNFVAGGEHSPNERPLRIEHLAQPVWIDREPVSGADWAKYLEHWPDPRQDALYLQHWGTERRCPPGREREPIYNLWPEDADLYASRNQARLPTASEWEKAVRGLDGRRWPWGDRVQGGYACTADLQIERPLPPRALGSQGEARLYSAVGGVFEYTSSYWRDRPDRGRVVMGGCFTHPLLAANPALRLSHKLSGHLKAGLRLAWDAP